MMIVWKVPISFQVTPTGIHNGWLVLKMTVFLHQRRIQYQAKLHLCYITSESAMGVWIASIIDNALCVHNANLI